MGNSKHSYVMTIERTILDDIGVKLYDKISAVVAELIANSYDADAENVTIELPLGKSLATRKKGNIEQKGYVIRVVDNGHGMTPNETNDFFLKVGKHRREDPKQGEHSRIKNRLVMGRKGLGKLAPFGVCKTIEVRSAGGNKCQKGYQVTHFKMDYDLIVNQTDSQNRNYFPTPLQDDRKWDFNPGTIITLKNFYPKNVPDKETFSRQISYRFGLGTTDFTIKVVDTKEDGREPEFKIEEVPIPLMDGTEIRLENRPIKLKSGKKLNVKGWIGMSKVPYKNEEFAGVRIYVRGKIGAITRDFGQPAGFKGEYVARSYLVGEMHADWLDDKEDLIQTHRQDILWSSELGQALAEWGRQLVKEVAAKGREPRRVKLSAQFLEKSQLHTIAHERYNNKEIEKAAIELGEKIGGFASEEELEDQDYVQGLSEIILTVAPHKLLVDTFKKIQELAKEGKIELKELIKLFETTQIAQLASYGQIVFEKIKVIDVFEKAINDGEAKEKEFQTIFENAPWLIDPRWQVMTANQSFKSFVVAFYNWYKKKHDVEIITSSKEIHENKRPDFIFLHQENGIKLIEIKPPKHIFNDADWERLNNYCDALTEFFENNKNFKEEFPKLYSIILITDNVQLKNSSYKKAFDLLSEKGILLKKSWNDLLLDVRIFHQSFLDERDKFNK